MSDENMSKDYEVNMLLNRRMFYRTGNNSNHVGLAYYYTRSIIRYMTRLLFAVGWNKIRDLATNSVNKSIYTTLFKDPTVKNGKNSIEPGTFAYLLKKSANNIGMASDVKKEVDLLYELANVRNYNAHEINTVDFKSFYEESDKVFAHFETYFEGKYTSYVIPREYINGQEVLCASFATGDSYPQEIRLESKLFKWSKLGNRLFYAVTDQNSRETKYYSLSPFIEVPLLIEDERPHFRTYDCVQDNGYGNECDSLLFDEAIPYMLQEITEEYGTGVSAIFKKTSADFRRSELFASQDIKEESPWVASFNNDVYINISSYPGFGDIIHHGFKYCMAVCPIRKNVVDFCKDDNKQVAQITGNGGVGKTALVLSILSEILKSKTEYFYSNLIFVSAKKKYISNKAMNYSLQDFEKEADIHDYIEFIERLADLLGIAYMKDTPIVDTENEIINQINGGTSVLRARKKFLLVIDDMDSLENPNQHLITEFVYKLDSRKFKTIVTTRNIADNSPVCYQVNELTEDQSILFAEWYTKNILGITSWGGWNRKKVAIEWIKKCGEGNPLTIQMLLTLVKAGLENTYDAPITKKERVAYLYSTVQNLLNAEERKIFELCRQLYIAIPDDKVGQDMLLSVPEYLSAACEVNSELFKKAIDKLVQLKLIVRSNNQEQFRPYSTFVLTGNIIEMDTSNLPSMFKLVWEDVRQHPDRWLAINHIENQIASFIISIEGEKKFDIVTARRILERILDNPYIYEVLKTEICIWLENHSIFTAKTDNDMLHQTAMRMIQSIENRWEILRENIRSGKEDPAEEQILNDEIHKLQKILPSLNNTNISQRLLAVRKEIKEIDDL